jgi:D-glucuronyl C5-epimerase C-terminus
LRLRKPAQRVGQFEPGQPSSGYYSDLRGAAGESPAAAQARLHELRRDPTRVNHVSTLQLGLGAWQLARGDPRWASVVAEVTGPLAADLEHDALLLYRFAMPHTYRLEPPWPSAMAQGQAASLLVRAAALLGRDDLLAVAERAVEPLLDTGSRLVAATPDGPVLQEYPTVPSAHVLNGWLFALFGVYDVSLVGNESETAVAARNAFAAGVNAVAARLSLYELAGGWSRYDLYPHPLPNVASPFYQRLHGQLLFALDRLSPHPVFVSTAERWSSAAEATLPLAFAVARKAAFRAVRPRRRL